MKILNILILIIIILFLILYIITTKEFFNNNPIDNNINLNIGNVLSAYFYDLGYSIISKKDFTHEPYEQIFFKDFPTFIPFSQSIDIYNMLIKKPNIINIFDKCKECLWTVNSKEIEYFWQCMKPLVQSIYNTAFSKNNLVKKIDNIVIHFRCADTPFCRHSEYHFQKYNFFKDALENIKKISKKDYKVTILYNNTHLSNDKNKKTSNIYANTLLQYITNLGYNVEFKSNSNIDDFAELYYAPVVISTYSSFSFMSGFFSNGIFISSGHFDENTMIRCNDCDDWLYKDYDLLHKDVVDYYDTNTVINQLNLSANNNNAPIIDKFLNTV